MNPPLLYTGGNQRVCVCVCATCNFLYGFLHGTQTLRMRERMICQQKLRNYWERCQFQITPFAIIDCEQQRDEDLHEYEDDDRE